MYLGAMWICLNGMHTHGLWQKLMAVARVCVHDICTPFVCLYVRFFSNTMQLLYCTTLFKNAQKCWPKCQRIWAVFCPLVKFAIQTHPLWITLHCIIFCNMFCIATICFLFFQYYFFTNQTVSSLWFKFLQNCFIYNI